MEDESMAKSSRSTEGVNRASEVRVDPEADQVSFRIDVQPRFLRTNLRYKFSHALPPEALQAMADVEESARCVARETGWHPGNGYIGLALDTYVNNRAIDVDSCHKRTQDAVCEGLGFDDSRVSNVRLERIISDDEHLHVWVWRVPLAPGERLPESWGGKSPVWDWNDEQDDTGEFDR